MIWPLRWALIANHAALHTYDAASQAIFAAFTTPPTAARKGHIDTLVRALKAAGVWDLCDLLYVLAAADSQAALINWKNPGTFTASVSAGSPTFSADHGYTGDGSTTAIATGYTAQTDAVQLTQNSAHLGVYALTITTTTAISDFGYTTSNLLNVRAGSITRGFTRMNSTTAVQGSGGISAPLHAIGIRRTSTNTFYFRNGTQNTTSAAANSSAIPALSGVSILKANNSFTDQQLAACHLGAALSDQQALDLYNALRTYMLAVGAHA